MLENINAIELVMIAALAYFAFTAFSNSSKMDRGTVNAAKTASALSKIGMIAGLMAGMLLLMSQGSDTETFGTAADPIEIGVSNFNATELIYLGGVGYAAYLAWTLPEGTKDKSTLAIGLSAVGAVMAYQAFTSTNSEVL
jgi:hypothetical protein